MSQRTCVFKRYVLFLYIYTYYIYIKLYIYIIYHNIYIYTRLHKYIVLMIRGAARGSVF
jgi:hypothetical protein